MNNRQVDKTAYQFDYYCDLARWSSYWYQLKEILALKPDNILEIGVGDKVISNYLKNNTNIKYDSLDIATDLQPDFIGSIEAMPMANENFEVVCAFEVLEHLPFDKFILALKEMRRVAKKYAIISLPHWSRHFSVDFRLPFLKRIRWQFKLYFLPLEHKFDGQHYWEIGKKGYPLKKIKQTIEQSGWKILDDYVVFESPYHHFFILEKSVN